MSKRYTLIDYFNGFQNLKRRKNFSAGVQSAYFAILGEFELQRYPAELALSTRELKELAGLKSVASAHEVRNVLKNNKLVDFETKRGTTIYKLLSGHLPNEIWTAKEQQANTLPNTLPNTQQTPDSLVCYTPNYTHAGNADEDEAAAESPSTPALPPAPPNPPTPSPSFLPSFIHPPTPQTGTPQLTDANANARALPLKSPSFDHDDLDEVVEYWQHNKSGGKLSFEHQSRLSIYLQDPQKGKEWVKKMMDIASDKNGNSKALMPKFLFGVIETELKEKTKKEDEKSGGYHYEKPVNTIDFDEP